MPSPQIVAGLLTLVVLATGLLSNVGAEETLLRAGIAYVVGLLAGNIWQSLFALPARVPSTDDENKEESDSNEEDSEPPAVAA
ncbi:MAG: hypothetical protein KF812_04910 [Fimbriimonadaceae bacterium]|nr:hypothetical protein [Fimbriimonadaceae bacterium]